LSVQDADDGGADQATVAGDEDAWLRLIQDFTPK
jgi:hypothetical protein